MAFRFFSLQTDGASYMNKFSQKYLSYGIRVMEQISPLKLMLRCFTTGWHLDVSSVKVLFLNRKPTVNPSA